mgnify:CR=1 FL=1
MILHHTLPVGRPQRKPRASGDDPEILASQKALANVNPARAGMILRRVDDGHQSAGKPRASGDDPVKQMFNGSGTW